MKKEIISFEIVTLSLSGMRGKVEYEIIARSPRAEVSYYTYRCAKNGGFERKPEERALCDEATILKLLNDCDLLSWDGFHGKHPRDVLDGTMFRLTATLNDGQTVRADGSQNFPKHFREFRDGLYAILHA
ncbi:MAG: hypothetical protein KIG36_02760 [Eubacteriales bacterium]|nr:hypothetical protein [Eubacteriales bacterium]